MQLKKGCVKEKKYVKKLFKRYEKLIPFTVMMMLEKIKKLFETTNNLGSLAVMIAVERQPLKKFLFRS